jgi:hypothetical protein
MVVAVGLAVTVTVLVGAGDPPGAAAARMARKERKKRVMVLANMLRVERK